MKSRILCIIIVVVCISFLIYEKRYKKQTIYISFKELSGYSYYYKKDSLGNDKTLVLKQEGKLNHVWWELDIDIDNIIKMEPFFVEEVDIVSQYWIINNISGLQIATKPLKAHNYNINVIKEVQDSLYVYPISTLHYLVE